CTSARRRFQEANPVTDQSRTESYQVIAGRNELNDAVECPAIIEEGSLTEASLRTEWVMPRAVI
ncbi:MAG TPA: hypothetical protein VFI14_12480, partial [Chryseosolibacter sp.]|nr:hypothetical protein [Chryseosolibacter sp.]